MENYVLNEEFLKELLADFRDSYKLENGESLEVFLA